MGSPKPLPSPLISESLDAEMKEAWDRAGIGVIAYNPDTQMVQGVTKPVMVRIAVDPNAPSLTTGLPPSPTVAALKVTGEMRAELRAARAGTFEIVKTAEKDERPLLPPYAEWKWMVTPLESGDHVLLLTITAMIELPDKRRREPVISKEATIHVRVDPMYVTKNFVQKNWQWLVGSPVVGGALAWLWAHRRRQKKRGAAGFRAGKDAENQ
jgi:hypothetical protein